MNGSSAAGKPAHFKYTHVSGFFHQDDPPRPIPATKVRADFRVPITIVAEAIPSFGLKVQPYDTDSSLPNNGEDLTQWQRFDHKLRHLNAGAAKGVSYHLLYLGRHGQGFHNVASRFYGSNAWDCYYSMLPTDPNMKDKPNPMTFHDADLTALGIHQANVLSKQWSKLHTTEHLPLPQQYFVSPLVRAIRTANLTFEPLTPRPHEAQYKPIVKEMLREGIGLHTCDQRSSRSSIADSFPNVTFEDGFSEEDVLYVPDVREPSVAHDKRIRSLLDDVLASMSSSSAASSSLPSSSSAADASTRNEITYMSFTSHFGSIRSFLQVLGHSARGQVIVLVGGMIPVVVKVEEVSGSDEKEEEAGVYPDEALWYGPPACLSDPLQAGTPGYRDVGEYYAEIEREVLKMVEQERE